MMLCGRQMVLMLLPSGSTKVLPISYKERNDALEKKDSMPWRIHAACCRCTISVSIYIFSDTTDGFKRHRKIYDSLISHIMMYENANMSHEHIYTGYP